MKSVKYEESEHRNSRDKLVPFSAESIGTRIEQLSARVGGKKELANLSGIHETQLYKYLKGANSPSIAVAVALAGAGNVSLDWLLLGKEDAVGGTIDVQEDIYAYVPLYDARCSAGGGSWNENSTILTRLAFTRYSLKRQGLRPDSLSAIRIAGDSMEPLLVDGDTVLIEHSLNTLEGEGVYVIHLDDHLYAKRLQRQFDGAIHIISENKAYKDMVVPKAKLNDLRIIGRVVWAGGWL